MANEESSQEIETAGKPLAAAKENCKEVANIKPGGTNEMGGKIQEMILNYYKDVRKQAQQSFHFALGATAVGVVFFGYAVYVEMSENKISQISLIAGSVIQIISGINFYLYGKASKQFSAFHICLERTNRFLLANTICDNVSDETQRNKTREDLIKTMANAPMITIPMNRRK